MDYSCVTLFISTKNNIQEDQIAAASSLAGDRRDESRIVLAMLPAVTLFNNSHLQNASLFLLHKL